MRYLAGFLGLTLILSIVGCGTRKSSLLLERIPRGPMDEHLMAGQPVEWVFEPVGDSRTIGDVRVTVNFASEEYQRNFFKNRKLFGDYAGKNPYFAQQLVFYVEIKNNSDEKIFVDPAEFVLVDDRGNQYGTIGADYVTAFAEYRAPVGTTTRGLIRGASPGYFGISVPVGRVLAGQPQGRFALLKQSALQRGYLYPEVAHDGLIAFWNPSGEAKKLRLLITNVKTDFDAHDMPSTSLEFAFEFDVRSD